ncbi:MAG: HlyD family efflux transporter periplasmic adaptor subunit, partial [Candidatus Zixiibacteriota bacterium]
QVRKAQAKVDQLLRDKRRVEELVNRGLEAKDKLETAESELEMARAELANKKSTLELLKAPPRPEEEAVIQSEIQRQQARLDYLTRQSEAQVIVSPISGIVSTPANSHSIELQVAGNDTVELLVPVSDFDLPLVHPGQQVSVKLRSYPRRVFTGEVVRIPEAAQGDADHAQFLVSVVVPNDDGLLRPGMSGYAKIHVGRISPFGLVWRKVLSSLRVEFWSWW